MMNCHSESGNLLEIVWWHTTPSRYSLSTAACATVTAFISYNRQKAKEPSAQNNKWKCVSSIVNNLKQILLKQARMQYGKECKIHMNNLRQSMKPKEFSHLWLASWDSAPNPKEIETPFLLFPYWLRKFVKYSSNRSELF